MKSALEEEEGGRGTTDKSPLYTKNGRPVKWEWGRGGCEGKGRPGEGCASQPASQSASRSVGRARVVVGSRREIHTVSWMDDG